MCLTYIHSAIEVISTWIIFSKHTVSLLALLFNRLITDVPIDADIIEILKRLKQVSQQPFKQHTQMPLECSTEKNMDVAYFPSLPVVRRRGIYTIDRKQKPDGCRKNSSRHPTLLPGIFTLFCQHGMY